LAVSLDDQHVTAFFEPGIKLAKPVGASLYLNTEIAAGDRQHDTWPGLIGAADFRGRNAISALAMASSMRIPLAVYYAGRVCKVLLLVRIQRIHNPAAADAELVVVTPQICRRLYIRQSSRMRLPRHCLAFLCNISADFGVG
jgi:hypothetical protein